MASLGNAAASLADADPADKAKIYTSLGPRLTLDPARKAVIAEAAAIGDHVQDLCRRATRPTTPQVFVLIGDLALELPAR